MKINPIQHNYNKQQVGFGMSQIKLEQEVKQLVKTSKDAQKILDFAEELQKTAGIIFLQ